jgi:uncharacterized OB-fold protein
MAYVSIPTYSRTIPQRYALIGDRCRSCGAVNLPRGVCCTKCGKGLESDPVKLSGRGKIYSFTTISRGGSPPEFSTQQTFVGAYPVAVIELDEGPKIVGQMADCRAEELKIGLEVESVFRRLYEDEGMIRYGVKFRPTRTSGQNQTRA